jgi:hypothetical protein
MGQAMTAGGNPPMRPDQALQPLSRAGTGPAPQNQVFIGRLFVAFGTGTNTGIFFYNGTPALGNAPLLAITTATSDPYGNPVTASAITDSGMPLLIYSGTAAAGDLITVVAPAPGTDVFGNKWSNEGLTVIGSGNQRIITTIIGGTPFQIFSTGVSEEGSAAFLEAILTNAGVAETMNLFMVGPQGTVHNDLASVLLNSAAKDGSATAGGALNYTDTSLAEHFWLEWGIKGVKVFSAISGDTNTYQPERLTQLPGGALTVNQTTFSQQVLPTLVIGVGTYHYRAQIKMAPQQAAGAPQFEFAGSVTLGMRIEFSELTQASPAVIGNAGELTALVAAFTGATWANVNERVLTIDGTIIATVAGTFALFAATTVALDTFIIRQQGTYQELFPAGP